LQPLRHSQRAPDLSKFPWSRAALLPKGAEALREILRIEDAGERRTLRDSLLQLVHIVLQTRPDKGRPVTGFIRPPAHAVRQNSRESAPHHRSAEAVPKFLAGGQGNAELDQLVIQKRMAAFDAMTRLQASGD